jgi:hypothetical protein
MQFHPSTEHVNTSHIISHPLHTPHTTTARRHHEDIRSESSSQSKGHVHGGVEICTGSETGARQAVRQSFNQYVTVRCSLQSQRSVGHGSESSVTTPTMACIQQSEHSVVNSDFFSLLNRFPSRSPRTSLSPSSSLSLFFCHARHSHNDGGNTAPRRDCRRNQPVHPLGRGSAPYRGQRGRYLSDAGARRNPGRIHQTSRIECAQGSRVCSSRWRWRKCSRV